MQSDNRPLSPHLQVYKPQLSSMLSITHRGTGIALTAGAFVLALWLYALLEGGALHERVHGIMNSWIGLLFLAGWTFALFYHLCNGIRHLVWDLGMGLDMDVSNRSGIAVIVSSMALTLVVWGLAYSI